MDTQANTLQNVSNASDASNVLQAAPLPKRKRTGKSNRKGWLAKRLSNRENLDMLNEMCDESPYGALAVFVLRAAVQDAFGKNRFRRQLALEFLASDRCAKICTGLGLSAPDVLQRTMNGLHTA